MGGVAGEEVGDLLPCPLNIGPLDWPCMGMAVATTEAVVGFAMLSDVDPALATVGGTTGGETVASGCCLELGRWWYVHGDGDVVG